MAHYLEPIIQALVLEAEDFLAGMRDVRKSMLDAARDADVLGEAIVQLDDVLDDMSISAGAAARAARDLGEAVVETSGAEAHLRDDTTEVVAALQGLDEKLDTLAGHAEAANLALGAIRDKLAEIAVASRGLNTSGLAKNVTAAGAAAGTAAQRFHIWGTGVRLSGNALHWVIGILAEFLAVAIPAAIAATAWAAAWVSGAESVAEHMLAVFEATQATKNMVHETAGQVEGLTGAFSKVEQAARPDVFAALGGAINLVNEQTGKLAQTGLQVGRVFDSFLAKLVYEFSAAGRAGSNLGGLVANMEPDLIELGQVVGQLGGAVAGFASQMPGLAEVLLKILDEAIRLGEVVINLAGRFRVGAFSIITLVMAFEEANRWGGLVVGILGRVGIAGETLSKGMLNPVRSLQILSSVSKALPMAFAAVISNIGSLMSGFGRFDGTVGKAGLAMRDFGADMTDAVVAMPAWQGAVIALAAVGIGFLIDKLITARSAAQQFADSLQQGIQKSTNLQVINKVATDIGELHQKLALANTSMGQYVKQAGSVQAAQINSTEAMAEARNAAGRVGEGYNGAAAAARTYSAAIAKLQQQDVNVAQGASYLATTYHTTLLGALVLADAANVHLTQAITGSGEAAAIARIKVANLVQGYESMGQPLGVVGNDMTAIAIQAGEQASKVSQLNQAWDSFMTNVTSGTSGLAGFENSLTNMTNTAASAKNNLAKSTVGMSDSTRQFADQLTSFTGKGAQAWQNFDQVVGSTGPQLIDFLRTAGSEGAITGKQFTSAVRDMIAQLLPLASKSKTATSELSALAQQAGGPATSNFQTLKAWVDKGHLSIGDLAGIISQATQKMGNMAQVAQQLGNVMQQNIINAMGEAAFKTSGVASATLKYTQDLRAGTSATAAGRGDRQNLIQDLERAGESAQEAAKLVRLLTSQIQQIPSHKQISITELFNEQVAPGTVPPGTLFPGSGGGGGTIPPHAGGFQGTIVHIHGSVLSGQEVARHVQTVTNQRTLRNGSTQLFIRGRAH